jgi:hypothetical protein
MRVNAPWLDALDLRGGGTPAPNTRRRFSRTTLRRTGSRRNSSLPETGAAVAIGRARATADALVRSCVSDTAEAGDARLVEDAPRVRAACDLRCAVTVAVNRKNPRASMRPAASSRGKSLMHASFAA